MLCISQLTHTHAHTHTHTHTHRDIIKDNIIPEETNSLETIISFSNRLYIAKKDITFIAVSREISETYLYPNHHHKDLLLCGIFTEFHPVSSVASSHSLLSYYDGCCSCCREVSTTKRRHRIFTTPDGQ